MCKKIYKVCFSPTGNTEKIVNIVGKVMESELDKKSVEVNITIKAKREEGYVLEEEDILIYGFPVYGGRVPLLLEKEMGNLKGNNTPAIIVCTYGNRAYEDALLEAYNILTSRGFNIVGAGAFLGEHSYTEKVGSNRPDEEDIRKAVDFGEAVCEKIKSGNLESINVKGNTPYKERRSMPYSPKTNDKCTNCGICIDVCPVEVIDKEHPGNVRNGCILCCACIKICPIGAKYIDAEPVKNIVEMLESKCLNRKEIEIFI